VIAWVILQRTAFGRKVYFIGANRAVAEVLRVEVGRVKTAIFGASSTVAALAGLLFAARVGRGARRRGAGVRARHHHHRPLGGVSIFGGVGSIPARCLRILIVLISATAWRLRTSPGTSSRASWGSC
jgi:ribose/xylose/arabinose/galactoside ABC-type transport system permease subunit